MALLSILRKTAIMQVLSYIFRVKTIDIYKLDFMLIFLAMPRVRVRLIILVGQFQKFGLYFNTQWVFTPRITLHHYANCTYFAVLQTQNIILVVCKWTKTYG